MNKNQRIVCGVLVAIILGMFIYPPFHLIRENGTFNAGFGFIFENDFGETVNLAQLLVQIIIVLVIGGIAWHALKDK